MKHVISLFFLLTFFAATSQTKDVDPAQIPKAVRENFIKENPGITPAWKMDGKNYKAFFTDAKTKVNQVVTYDPKGSVLHRENAMENPAAPGVSGE